MVKREYSLVRSGSSYLIWEDFYILNFLITSGVKESKKRSRIDAYKYLSEIREKETENREENKVYLVAIVILTILAHVVFI